MVQYRQEAGLAAKADITAKEYWKLEPVPDRVTARRYLSSKGITYKRSKNLTHLYGRTQQGLLNYHTQSFDDLLKFCRARGLGSDSARTRESARVRMIARLEKADSTASFQRFLNLPSELRVAFCVHHFADLYDSLPGTPPEEGYQFVQPPISLVNKLIRKELLPEFYQIFAFGFTVSREVLATRTSHGFRYVKAFFISGDAFVTQAPRKMLDRLRVVKISGAVRSTDCTPMVLEVEIDLKLGVAAVKVSEQYPNAFSAEDNDGQNTVRELAEARVEAFVRERKQSDGSLKLRLNDGPAIKALFEDVSGRLV